MLDTSKIYQSNNCGPFKIVNYRNSFDVEIEFINTGFRRRAHAGAIRNGQVKDPFAPSVYGVAFLGVGEYIAGVKGKHAKAYAAWFSMIQRCYCLKCQKKHPTYKGCSVCDEWLNFQTFASWFEDNYTEGSQIDKDIRFKGNKIYAPSNCLFAPQGINVIEAQAKHWVFKTPEGEETKVYNLAEFCRKNDLDRSNMYRVHSGKANHHKNWTKQAIS